MTVAGFQSSRPPFLKVGEGSTSKAGLLSLGEDCLQPPATDLTLVGAVVVRQEAGGVRRTALVAPGLEGRGAALDLTGDLHTSLKEEKVRLRRKGNHTPATPPPKNMYYQGREQR